jgi:hypothetical protein
VWLPSVPTGAKRGPKTSSPTGLLSSVAELIDGERSKKMSEAQYPVTAEEIDAFWRKATQRRPVPDMQQCGVLASAISRLMPQFRRQVPALVVTGHAVPARALSPSGVRRRRRDAIVLLRNAIADRPATLNDDGNAIRSLDGLKAYLAAAEPVLCDRPQAGNRKEWHSAGYFVAEHARQTLINLGGKARMVSGNGNAARFTQLVLKRLGFGEITTDAIAAHHAREQVRLGLTTNSPGGKSSLS